MTDQQENRDYELGDVVRFTDVHHAMNGSLKSHEGHLGKVTGVDRGWSDDQTLVKFLEGSTKKVGDEWDIREDRLTPADDGPWEFSCTQCGCKVTTDSPDSCPECKLDTLQLSKNR